RLLLRKLCGSQRVGVGFARADAHGVLDREHEDLAVADLSGLGRIDDRVNRLVDEVGGDGHLDLDLRQEAHRVFGASVDFGVTFLTSVTLHFGDGQALDADAGQRFADLVELERLYDCHHDLHTASPFADAG